MSGFLLNLVLALAWAALMGRADAATLAAGLVLGYLVVWWVEPALGSRWARRLPRAVAFAGFFLWEVLLSNLRVAWDVVTPRAYRRPGVVAVPLDVASDAEITLLACLLGLTPGTLALDVAADRKVLYVHAMFVDDPEAFRRHIKDGFERRVMELLR